MFRIAICDDDPTDRAALREALLRGGGEPSDISISEFSSGERLLFAAEEGLSPFDALFLDIYMPRYMGMDVARKLRGIGFKQPIVFLTTSPDFAVESYDVEAFGYLLKPLDERKLAVIMEKLLSHRDAPRLAVKCQGRPQYCEYGDIVYLESSNNITLIHLAGGQTLRCARRLNALETEINDGRFLRCHQSYLVNMDYIRRVDGDFILKDGRRVPVRVRGRKEITDAYYNFFVAGTVAKLPEMEERHV